MEHIDLEQKMSRKDFLQKMGIGILGLAAMGSPVAYNTIKKTSSKMLPRYSNRGHSEGVYGKGIYS